MSMIMRFRVGKSSLSAGDKSFALRCALLAFLGAWSWGAVAQASEAPEVQVLQGTDTLGNHPLSLNTAALNPKKSGLTFAEQVRNRSLIYRQDTTGTTTSSTFQAEETLRVAEFLASVGGLIYGAGLTYGALEFRSTSDQSNTFDETPLLELSRRTEARGKVGIEITKDLRFGGMVRYRYLDADVLGSFNLPLDERTRYSGGLLGAGAGAQFNAQSASLAVQYLSPIEGKVNFQGEDKVTSDPGLLSGCGHLKPFANTALGGCYLLVQHGKDELRANSTGPNPANPQQMAPKGVSRERNVFLLDAAALGLGFGVGSGVEFKTTGFMERYAFISSPGSTISEPKTNLFQGYRARMSLAYDKNSVFAEIGADGALREVKLDPNGNGQIDSVAIREYNFFGTLGLQL